MTHHRIASLSLLMSSLSLIACGGGGEAAGLKYRVSDKELRGLTGDGVVRIDTAKQEVTKLQDALALGVTETNQTKKTLEGTNKEKAAAGDAIEAAADKIEATTDRQESELAKAREERDKKIAEAKQRYDDETKQIRERHAAEQAKNRKVLADAKTQQQIAALEANVLKAELAENKARQALRLQEIRVAQANVEVVKHEELLKMTGVTGPSQTQRKINLEQQSVNEQKKLIELQTRLQKAEAASAAERQKLEAEKAKLAPAPN